MKDGPLPDHPRDRRITRRAALLAGAGAGAMALPDLAAAQPVAGRTDGSATLLPAACVAIGNVPHLSGLRTVDGYRLRSGDVVLLTGQTETTQNGPWTAASGAWARPRDFPAGSVTGAVTIAIIEGKAYGGSIWLLRTTGTVTVDTTAQMWVLQLQRTVLVASQNPTNARAFCAADGVTDDTAALQALLNAGGEVYLPAGTAYYVTGLTVPVSGTRLFGSGTLVWSDSSADGIFIPDGVTDVAVSGITITGVRAGPVAGHAVSARGLRHTFRDLHIHDVPQSGIAVWGDTSHATTLIRSIPPGAQTIDVASSAGFLVGASIQLSPGTTRIEENIVSAVRSPTTIDLDHPTARSHERGDGVTQAGTQHVLVRDCKVSAAGGNGILVNDLGAADGPAFVSLIGNHVDLPGLAGINASGSHLLIVGNLINAPGALAPHADGITFYDRSNEDVLVADNSVFSSGNNGIHGGGNRVHVVGNTVETCWGSSGLFVSSDPNSGPTFSRVAVISGNRVANVLDSSGIIVYGYANVTLSSNTVHDVYAYGISVEYNVGNAQPEATDTVAITGNSIQASHTNSGIHLLGVTRASIAGNVVTDCAQAGIELADVPGVATADCAISGNTINNCPAGAVITSGTARRVLATGNSVRGCGNQPFANGGVPLGLTVIANQTDLPTLVTSGPELAVPLGLDVVAVADVGAISGVDSQSAFSGRILTLMLTSTCEVSTAGNIRLFGGLGQVMPAGSTLTLVCDGSGTWHETSGPSLPQYDRDNAQSGMYATPSGMPPNADVPLVAGRLYLMRFVPSRILAVVKAGFGVATASSSDDPLDIGIYDGAGTLLWHLGPTRGLLNKTGVSIAAVTPTLALAQRTIYYAALLCQTAGSAPASLTGVTFGPGGADPGALLFCDDSSGSLPAAEAGVVDATSRMPSAIGAPLGPSSTYPVLALRES